MSAAQSTTLVPSTLTRQVLDGEHCSKEWAKGSLKLGSGRRTSSLVIKSRRLRRLLVHLVLRVPLPMPLRRAWREGKLVALVGVRPRPYLFLMLPDRSRTIAHHVHVQFLLHPPLHLPCRRERGHQPHRAMARVSHRVAGQHHPHYLLGMHSQRDEISFHAWTFTTATPQRRVVPGIESAVRVRIVNDMLRYNMDCTHRPTI